MRTGPPGLVRTLAVSPGTALTGTALTGTSLTRTALTGASSPPSPRAVPAAVVRRSASMSLF
ncbi:hypothetical protein AB0J52_24275 [Spirillospora sp. NPDC049652]